VVSKQIWFWCKHIDGIVLVQPRLSCRGLFPESPHRVNPAVVAASGSSSRALTQLARRRWGFPPGQRQNCFDGKAAGETWIKTSANSDPKISALKTTSGSPREILGFCQFSSLLLYQRFLFFDITNLYPKAAAVSKILILELGGPGGERSSGYR